MVIDVLVVYSLIALSFAGGFFTCAILFPGSREEDHDA